MIIKQPVVELMNEQIKNEFGASQQYIAIAIYFDEESLPDLAGFFYAQAEEEREHAMKFVHFLLETGAHPIIPSLSDFRNKFNSPEDAVGYALEQELMVTDQINNIMSVAVEEKDHASTQFLQWFVDEQVEEVSSMEALLQTIKHSNGMLLFVEDYVRRVMVTRESEEE